MSDAHPRRIRRTRGLVAALAAGLGCGAPQPPGVGEQPLALVGVHVIAMTREGVLADQTLVVRGGRIEALGPARSVQVPWNATRIDAHGQFALPGLVDMHAHVTGARSLRQALARGVTTLRNMRGDARHLAWRQELAERRRLGPRLVTAGPQLAGEGSASPDVVLVRNAGEARAAVRAQAEAGFDFVKVYEGLSRSAYRAALAEAAARALPVAGHVPAEVGIYAALAQGQASIEHAEELTQGTKGGAQPAAIPELVAQLRSHDTWICPTLALHALFSPRHDHAFRGRLVAALHEAGVGVLAGSDSAPAGLAEEVEALAGAGLTPYQALLAATAGPARFLGRADQFGTLAVGLDADLLLLERNPLEDLGALERPAGLLARGQWLDAARLARLAR
jgi:imidazolonepropionase-like amidohydrolase